MASSKCKINRRTVRQVIKTESITGTSLEACAINITALLGLHPSCHYKINELLGTLVRQGEIILSDAMLRLSTESEQRISRETAANERLRQKRTRERTASKRTGGMRQLKLRTTRPIPLSLVS